MEERNVQDAVETAEAQAAEVTDQLEQAAGAVSEQAAQATDAVSGQAAQETEAASEQEAETASDQAAQETEAASEQATQETETASEQASQETETASEQAAKETEMAAEQPVQETEAVPEQPAETMADYAVELEASFRKISEGDIISGTVIDVSEDGVVLDLRYYTQGIVKTEDMSDAPDFSILSDVKVGDVVEGTVVSMDDGQGNIQMSRKSANQVLAWDKLQKYMDEGRDLTVKIGGVTNGGAIVYVEDIRGFIPASQLSLEYVEDVNPWLGKTLKVRIITVDRSREKLVLSAKVILKEEAAEEHSRRVSMIIPGIVLEGTVESLMPYGAFINLGDGLSGLVHISQISQKRIKKPSEVLNVGDKVKAKVLNTNDGKISLSMKALEENMEAEAIEDFHYESEGNATTSLGSLFANIKLDL